MIQKLRWWLVRKLIGRSSVMANIYIERSRGELEICTGPGLIYGNQGAFYAECHTCTGRSKVWLPAPTIQTFIQVDALSDL